MSELSLRLKGLDCNSCEEKIETGLKKIKDIDIVSYDNKTKNIDIRYKNIPKEELISRVIIITNGLDHNHNIIVEERADNMVLIFKGLNCGSCAEKIERNVKKLDGVVSASINLINQELKLEYSRVNKNTLIDSITKITHELEPDVIVSEKEEVKVITNEMTLTLKGLNCGSCAEKIERNVKKLDGVVSASINLINQELKLEYSRVNKNTLIDSITKITHELEPDVIVSEKAGKLAVVDNSFVLTLKGLNCGSCAEKIERNVAGLEGVVSSNINLINQELKVEYEGNKSNLIEKITKITNELEPDVIVSEKENKSRELLESEARLYGAVDIEEIKDESAFSKSFLLSAIDDKMKKRLLSYGLGVILYIMAVTEAINPSFSIYFYIGAYLIFGSEVVIRAIRNIRHGEVFDENFLMSISTIGAFIIGQYSEAVAVMLFYRAGEFFQDMAVERSRNSIRDLMDLKSDYANLIVNGEERKVNPELINIGDIILVKPGERVPLDGIVIDGDSQVDMSSLIGESVPRSIGVDEEILSGSVNLTGAITIEVTKLYNDSTVSKIMDMVESASSRKAPTEQFITRFSRIYTPAVVLAATLLAIVPPLVIPGAQFSDWVYRGLVFLVVSCPCALVISVPLSFFSGIGSASRKGVLVKGSTYLEELTKMDTMVFDKTGTLTEGVFRVTDVHTAKDVTEEELFKSTYALEKLSNHPIAKSIVAEYGNRGYDENISDTEKFEEIAGHGVKGEFENSTILVGNGRLMEMYDIDYDEYNGFGTILYVAKDNKYLGYIIISDIIKADSKEAIRKLKEAGVKRTVMLTGDNKKTADIIGKELGIDEIYSELLPDKKVEAIEDIYKNHPDATIGFAGDGINDAPGLARSDVGIAMGGVGSDAAIEAADIVIMTDEPSKIVDAITTANNTMKIVKQNITLALVVKFLALFLSAIGRANMWFAVFADVGVTLIAIANSVRSKD